MIERLATTLRAIARHPALDAPDGRALRADAADAARLALDCMQNDLTAPQRATLRRLWEALEEPDAPADGVRAAAREAGAALGITPAASHDA